MQSTSHPLEDLFIKDFINEGECRAGLCFQRLNFQMRRLIKGPRLSRTYFAPPEASKKYNENDDDKIEMLWRKTWRALHETGVQASQLVESVAIYEERRLKTAQDLKTLRAGLGALEKEFARDVFQS